MGSGPLPQGEGWKGRRMPTRMRMGPMASETKGTLLSRLRTIEGHVRGILRMVEADAYCPEVLMQGLAVQRAIDRFNYELLESHLDSCFVSAVRGNSEADRERALRELLGIFQASVGLKGSRIGSGVTEGDGQHSLCHARGTPTTELAAREENRR